MNTKNKPALRWPLLLGYIGVLAVMLACVSLNVGVDPGGTPTVPEDVPIHLVDGVVEVPDENGDWTPVAGDSTFDLTAALESTDPWKVAGITLATNESTQIEEGLQAGDLVRVRGIILEDGTWLANSIESAAEQVDPIIILIGRVDSVDPWVVNGIQLNVTADTEIQGTITSGMFVRVEILLSPDGTWEVLSIAPLGEVDENPDCGIVVATVVSVEGNEIQLAGWPVITLGEDIKIEDDQGGEGTLSPNQAVLVVVCPSGEGQIVIIQIIIINTGDSNDEGEVPGGGEGGKVLVCHKPDKKGGHTLSISSSAVPAHLGHGDTLGPCR
jgi:uncharacterized protein DUF5666